MTRRWRRFSPRAGPSWNHPLLGVRGGGQALGYGDQVWVTRMQDTREDDGTICRWGQVADGGWYRIAPAPAIESSRNGWWRPRLEFGDWLQLHVPTLFVIALRFLHPLLASRPLNMRGRDCFSFIRVVVWLHVYVGDLSS